MKRVLVTGASGFVGRQSLLPLRERGFDVHAAAIGGVPSDLEPLAKWHDANLLQPNIGVELIQDVRPSHILHFAWDTEHGAYWSSPFNVEWLAASLRLVRAFGETGGIRIVVAGSCAEYDWNCGHMVEYQTPLAPRGLYGVCKNALREVAGAYLQMTRMSFAWGRLFCVYGPFEKSARLIPRIVKALSSRHELPFDEGAQERDFLHSSDAGDAFAALLDSNIQGDVNIASGQSVRIREVVETISQLVDAAGCVRFGTLPSSTTEPQRLTASVERLRDELGWRPRLSLRDGLQDVIDKSESRRA